MQSKIRNKIRMLIVMRTERIKKKTFCIRLTKKSMVSTLVAQQQQKKCFQTHFVTVKMCGGADKCWVGFKSRTNSNQKSFFFCFSLSRPLPDFWNSNFSFCYFVVLWMSTFALLFSHFIFCFVFLLFSFFSLMLST